MTPKRWWTSVSPGRRAAGIAIVVAALVSALLAVPRTVHDTTEDPRFCAAKCHTAQASASDANHHHQGVGCQSCHETSAKTGAALLWYGWFGGGKPAPAHGKVDEGRCASCHSPQGNAASRLVASTEGHRAHGPERAALSCTQCHAKSEHGPSTATESCGSCHEQKALHKTPEGLAGERCVACHGFTVGREGTPRSTAKECGRCHDDPGASHFTGRAPEASLPLPPTSPLEPRRPAPALHGTVDCKLCHSPHGDREAQKQRAMECQRCHEIPVGDRASVPSGHRVCVGCHVPHSPLGFAPRACGNCHDRAKVPFSKTATTTALRHDACTSCHTPHKWKAEHAGCVKCHEAKSTKLLNEGPKGHATCTQCHDPHKPPPNGTVCVTCHKDKQNHLTSAPERHQNCGTSCHDPHGAKSVARTACGKCHDHETEQVATTGPAGHAKAGCLGCHQQHGSPLPAPGLCATCHQDKGKLVATAGPEPHRKCLSCHKPHTFSIPVMASACANCHATIVAGGGSHAGDCRKCHTPHGSPRVVQASCLTCHTKIQAIFDPPRGNVKHADCESCHKPHRPAKMAVEQCKGCHTREATVAASWPAASPHAGKCADCHKPHSAQNKADCQSCHVSEGASAKGGKHRCTQCHVPHDPPPAGRGIAPTPGVPTGWWTRCQGCHVQQAEGVSHRGATHGKCNSCHKPHEFKKPVCTSCHTDQAKRAAHGVPAHSDCTKCHETHASTPPTREKCLACHANKKDHQPASPRCQTCHLFK